MAILLTSTVRCARCLSAKLREIWQNVPSGYAFRLEVPRDSPHDRVAELMARPVKLDNPLVLWRHAMRGLRNSGRLTDDPRHAALRDRIEIALFRVPARQREVVKRYDLSGEPAVEVQRALGISARQFFRDRRAALTELKTLLPDLLAPPPVAAPVPATPPRSLTHARDATLSGRASARSLAQTGNAECLDLLRELAANATDSIARTDLFLELAELALDFDDGRTARAAVEAALHVRNN